MLLDSSSMIVKPMPSWRSFMALLGMGGALQDVLHHNLVVLICLWCVVLSAATD